jgi:hypothetical protein
MMVTMAMDMAMVNKGEYRETTTCATPRTDLALRHFEGLADDILLHLRTAVLVVLLRGALVEHLVLGPNVHRDVQERLVQEGHAGFEAPRHRRS